MTPADLRHRVTIQALPSNSDGTPQQDAYGQQVLTWSDVMTVFAAIEPIGASEGVTAESLVAVNRYRVTLRWRSWITARHRLIYAGRMLEIKSVTDVDERHFWTEIECEAGASLG